MVEIQFSFTLIANSCENLSSHYKLSDNPLAGAK